MSASETPASHFQFAGLRIERDEAIEQMSVQQPMSVVEAGISIGAAEPVRQHRFALREDARHRALRVVEESGRDRVLRVAMDPPP